MPQEFSDFPNELLLKIGKYLEPRDLHSLLRVSRHFSTLFLSRLRGLALRKENTHAAIYWALASRNRTMLKRVLEEGENVIILINSSKVVHRSPKKCSEWILAWMLDERPKISLHEPGLIGGPQTIVSWAIRTGHQAVIGLLVNRAKMKQSRS